MIAAVVLAAGLSRRMGRDKLLLPLDGAPLFQKTVDLAVRLPFAARLVVTNTPQIAAYAAVHGCQVVPSPRAEAGMGCSVAAGAASLPEPCTGVIFFNADQPFLTAEAVTRLCRRFWETDQIAVPVTAGAPTAPCVFPRRFWPELAALNGTQGGRAVYRRHPDETVFVPMDDPALFRDVDVPADCGWLHEME